ncbi:unnamed protein product [Closterium sp. Naga37s-1]|nr:unnamed protein product [Closterium sp. Naga37s-1]
MSMEERSKFKEETLVPLTLLSEVNNDSYAGEAAFNMMSMEERSKFEEETLVTVLAATEGTLRLPEIKSASDLREALTRLGSIPADELQVTYHVLQVCFHKLHVRVNSSRSCSWQHSMLHSPTEHLNDTLTEHDLILSPPSLSLAHLACHELPHVPLSVPYSYLQPLTPFSPTPFPPAFLPSPLLGGEGALNSPRRGGCSDRAGPAFCVDYPHTLARSLNFALPALEVLWTAQDDEDTLTEQRATCCLILITPSPSFPPLFPHSHSVPSPSPCLPGGGGALDSTG